MKKIVLPAALLAAVAAAACTAPAPVNNTNQTANTNAATPTPAPPVPSAELVEKDMQVYEAVKRKDWDAFAAMLADDQLYVTTDGVHDKAATIEAVKKLDLADITFADSKVVNVASDLAVVTFTSRARGTYDGKPVPAGPRRESTAWVNRGGKWLAVYHQDTEVEEPSAAPSPGGATPAPTATAATTPATPTPASSASPAATPASPATATDAERQIWEALKRRDWDAFAALLAEDQIEVWGAGVFDKAGSLAGVKQVDLTGATLSDFREVKLTPNVSLVTYVARGPRQVFGPGGERQASIWANRGGRWLAVFHQGTRIK